MTDMTPETAPPAPAADTPPQAGRKNNRGALALFLLGFGVIAAAFAVFYAVIPDDLFTSTFGHHPVAALVLIIIAFALVIAAAVIRPRRPPSA